MNVERQLGSSGTRLGAVLIALIFIGLLFSIGISKEIPLGSISGVVIQEGTNKPIAGALVYHPTRNTYVKTDSEGKYTLYGVPVGKYEVRVYSKAYFSSYYSGVIVREGELTQNVNFKMVRRYSSFYLSAYQKVFNPDEKASINIRGYLVKNVEYKIYRVNPLHYMDVMTDYRSINNVNTDSLEPVIEAKYTSHFDEDGNFQEDIPLNLNTNGLYIIKAKAVGGRQTDSAWLLRTDLGLIIKRAPGKVLVYAQSFTTGKPVPGATVRVFKEKERIGIGVTDSNGIFTQGVNTDSPLKISANSGDSFAMAGTYYGGSAGKFKTYFYTERPVYRPGQKVYFKGIVRERINQGYGVKSGMEVKVKISDSKGISLDERSFYTNNYGTFNGSVDLPADAPLGDYSVSAVTDRDYSYASFKVSEYKKPEYKIEVIPDKKHYVKGDVIRLKVKGSYYFGGPVAGAPYRLTVYENTYYWGRPEWQDYYVSDSGRYGGIFAEKSGRLNEKGEAEIEIDTSGKEVNISKTLEAEAEVTDISGRAVTGTEYMSISTGEFAVYAYTDKYLYPAGSNVTLNVEALDFENKPVAGRPVSVKIQHVSYKEVKKEFKTRDADGRTKTIDEYKIEAIRKQVGKVLEEKTNKEGTAKINTKLELPGSYEFEIKAKDRRGNDIEYTAYAYVTDSSQGSSLSEADLDIITDKKRYELGDTVKAAITCSKPGTYVLITVEGRQLYKSYVVKIEKGSINFELPLADVYFPNCFISVLSLIHI